MRCKTLWVLPTTLALLLAFVGPAAAGHWEFRATGQVDCYGAPVTARVFVADAFDATAYGGYGASAFVASPFAASPFYGNFGFRTFAVPTNEVFLGRSVFVTPGHVTVVGPHGGPWHGRR